MKRLIVPALVAIGVATSASASEQLPTDRVIQFLTNIHTDSPMDATSWLLMEARDAERFRAFGGLDATVRQTSSLAHRYGGLRSVNIKQATKKGDDYAVTAQVTFFDEKDRKRSPAAAEREDMVWHFKVAKEAGVWKLAF